MFANIVNVYLPLKSVLDAGVEVLFNKLFVIETDNRAFGTGSLVEKKGGGGNMMSSLYLYLSLSCFQLRLVYINLHICL